MNMKQLRKSAAELARDCRKIERKGEWTTREWNDQVRSAIRNYMNNALRFHRAHGTTDH
jgi:hypothetical protein